MKILNRLIAGLVMAVCTWAQSFGWVENEVLVKFTASANTANTLAALGITYTKQAGGTGALLIRSQSSSTSALVAALRQRTDVIYVEPNYRVKSFASPNDTRYGDQWWLPRIKAPEAWDVSTGSGARVVAVLDSGIDYMHPDLSDNIWTAVRSHRVDIKGKQIWCDGGRAHGFNTFTDACDTLDDWTGHGTAVAGVIGAKGNNERGVAGVNWTTKIMAVKFLDSFGQGNVGDAIDGIEYILQTKESLGADADIRVITTSWGWQCSSPCASQALKDQIARAGQKGIIFVAAAGNSEANNGGYNNDQYPVYPANYSINTNNVISVAATNASDYRITTNPASNYGATTVQLAAPGAGILSTYPLGLVSEAYAAFTGTSAAAALVAGSAALVVAACPTLSVTDLRGALYAGARPLSSLIGQVSKGLLDVNGAIRSCTPIPVDASVVGRDFSSETILFQGLSTLTSSNVTITGSAAVTFTAGTTIRLLPEFRVTAGSAPVTFRARIQ